MSPSLAVGVAANPLLSDWSQTQPFGLPPFKDIFPSHFAPAFAAAHAEHKAELAAIAACPDPPSFENTAAALDGAGRTLDRVRGTYANLCSSCSSAELQAVESELAAPLAAHAASVCFTPGLFSRLVKLKQEVDSGALAHLDAEQVRLVERLHLDFKRAGAELDPAGQARCQALAERLATLTTRFTQTVTLDESEFLIGLQPGDLDGCPPELVAAAKANAATAGGAAADVHGSGLVASLARSFVEPLLGACSSRAVREKVFRAWAKRGELEGTGRDNKGVAVEILRLRAELAELHGHATFAEYNLADTMARSPAAVQGLLAKVWPSAKVAAARERAALEANAAAYFAATEAATEAEGGGKRAKVEIEAWDWRFFAERVAKSGPAAFDEAALKPYFSLDAMLRAVFAVAHHLWGLTFEPLGPSEAGGGGVLELYHPDVRAFAVRQGVRGGGDPATEAGSAAGGSAAAEKGALVAIFLLDPFARPYKQSGAWMSEYRTQGRDPHSGARTVPIVVNNCNFVKAPAAPEGGEGGDGGGGGAAPTLLSFDEATTLFHEFGHGCHGMLSDVKYSRLAGTSVLRDFVELPSQLMEHWLLEPAVLAAHATHWETGEAVPPAMVAQLVASRAGGVGFATVEYAACALLDQKLHLLDARALGGGPGSDGDTGSGGGGGGGGFDLNAWEATALRELGMPQGIGLRHRLPHFQHLFSSSMYAAAYYVYLWAEVLDCDAFEAFKEAAAAQSSEGGGGSGDKAEAGSCFDPATARRLRETIYSVGGSVEPGQAFRNFRGRDPSVIPMLRKKLALSETEARAAEAASARPA